MALEHTNSPLNQIKYPSTPDELLIVAAFFTRFFFAVLQLRLTSPLVARSAAEGFQPTRASAGTRTTSPTTPFTSAAWTASPARAP